MNNQPIVLCDEDLEGIHGGDPGSWIIAGVIAYYIAKALSAAPGVASQAVESLNSSLGPPGSYNPYSNPINCEYAGYY